MDDSDVQAAMTHAEQVVADFTSIHHAAAIPALIGACVMWAVKRGATSTVKGSLKNAVKLADQMHKTWRDA